MLFRSGVFASCEARLIVDDSNKTDDTGLCKNLLQMGADWWINQTSGWLADWSANSGIGNGRAKWITTQWQSFNYCSLSSSQILQNPPDLEIQTIKNINYGSLIHIFPNPTVDKLNINFQENFNSNVPTISIFDIYGKVVAEQTISQQNEQLNVAFFANGVYIIKISYNGNLKVYKFLKL